MSVAPVAYSLVPPGSLRAASLSAIAERNCCTAGRPCAAPGEVESLGNLLALYGARPLHQRTIARYGFRWCRYQGKSVMSFGEGIFT